jgi:hypothetical protein
MMDDWTRMIEALASPDQPSAGFAVCEALTKARVGAMLFTVTGYDPASSTCYRLYTDAPDVYPLSGEKPMSVDAWSETVMVRHQLFVANTIEDIALVFFDHPLIKSLGLGSVINVPIVVGGHVRATVNILHETGFYTPARVEAAMTLRPLYAVAALAAFASWIPT